MDKLAVIVPAAGFGRRMGTEVAKQFIEVGGKTLLAHSVDKLQQWAEFYGHDITLVVALSKGTTLPKKIDKVETCVGGETRADSVANALKYLDEKGDFTWAIVHDAARPLVDIAAIERLFQAVKNDPAGGILAEKVTATVKRADGDKIVATVPRENLWLAQTPQLFRFHLLSEALAGERAHLTDEASAIEALGYAPKVVVGNRENIKITTPDDLAYCQRYLNDSHIISTMD